METQAKTYEPSIVRIEKVWTPDAHLVVPHDERVIKFVSPSFGSNTYQNVGQEILSKNLNVPTGDYITSLLHSAYCFNNVRNTPEFKDVRDIMKSNWLWVFNRNLWTEKGVYVFQDSEAKGRSQLLDINELEKMLKDGKEINGIRFSNDGRVRFAPKESYKLGEHTSESFAKDGFMIASCKQEGAEKLGEVSAEFKNKPYIYGLEIQEGQTSELRVSAVNVDDGRLWFLGYYWSDYDRSHAFGVLK
jgi:hypothetical protein